MCVEPGHDQKQASHDGRAKSAGDKDVVLQSLRRCIFMMDWWKALEVLERLDGLLKSCWKTDLIPENMEVKV